MKYAILIAAGLTFLTAGPATACPAVRWLAENRIPPDLTFFQLLSAVESGHDTPGTRTAICSVASAQRSEIESFGRASPTARGKSPYQVWLLSQEFYSWAAGAKAGMAGCCQSEVPRGSLW